MLETLQATLHAFEKHRKMIASKMDAEQRR
jgi:hypothetical protein